MIKSKLKPSELIKILQEGLLKHGDDIPIYFDTEARSFEYHMSLIGNVYVNEEPYKHISLHEAI